MMIKVNIRKMRFYNVFCVDGEYGKNTKESRKQVDKEK